MDLIGYDKIVELRNKQQREDKIIQEKVEKEEKRQKQKLIKYMPELIPPQDRVQLYDSHIYDPSDYMYQQYMASQAKQLSQSEIHKIYDNAQPAYKNPSQKYHINNTKNINPNNVHYLDDQKMIPNSLYKINYGPNKPPVYVQKESKFKDQHPIIQEILELGKAKPITPPDSSDEEDQNDDNLSENGKKKKKKEKEKKYLEKDKKKEGEEEDGPKIKENPYDLKNLKLRKPIYTKDVYKVLNKYTDDKQKPTIINPDMQNNQYNQHFYQENNPYYGNQKPKEFYTYDQYKLVHMYDADVQDPGLSGAQREQIFEIKYMDYKLKNQYEYQKNKDYVRFEYVDQVLPEDANSRIQQNYFSNYREETVDFRDLKPLPGMPQEVLDWNKKRSQPVYVGGGQKKMGRFRSIPVIPKFNMYEQK